MKQIATIRLCNLIVYGYHGVLSEENTLGQRFEIDLEYQFDCSETVQSDEVKVAISYADIYDLVNKAMTEKQFKLLETLGDYIIDQIKAKFPVLSVLIKIRKPSVPIPAVLDHVEVELSWAEESTS